jgi:hypothetical protein
MKVDFSAFQDTTVEWKGRPLKAVRASRVTRTIYCLALLAFALPALGQGASWIAPATGGALDAALATWLFFLVSAAMAYRAYGVVSYADTLDARPPYLVGWLMRWAGWLVMVAGIAGLLTLLLLKPLTPLLITHTAGGGADSLRVSLWATVLAGSGWLGCVLFEISRWAGHRVTPRPRATSAGRHFRGAGIL